MVLYTVKTKKRSKEKDPYFDFCYLVAKSKMHFDSVMLEQLVDTSDFEKPSTKFVEDSSGPVGKPIRSAFVVDVTNVRSIIEVNWPSKDRFNQLYLELRAPYERWYTDLTGPHPKSEKGNIWILTCMDSFTKWTEAFPLQNKEAETIAKILVEQVFNRFSTALSILSDQGKDVDGRIMNELCRPYGIEKLRTTPYKPSTNQLERFHRTMNSILAKTVSDHHRDWDSHLSFALAAFRATRHEFPGVGS